MIFNANLRSDPENLAISDVSSLAFSLHTRFVTKTMASGKHEEVWYIITTNDLKTL